MKSAASVNGIAQETQKKKNKISCRRPPRTQQEKGKKWKKIERGENQATQKRREHGLRRREAGWDGRKKRRRGIGGGVRECKWREAESKEPLVRTSSKTSATYTVHTKLLAPTSFLS